MLVSSSLDGTRRPAPAYIISPLVVVSSGNLGQLAVSTYLETIARHSISILCSGSGSTYVYGYCDATYQEGWGKDETVNFVKNSKCYIYLSDISTLLNITFLVALALAMSRDGSSGGCIRMCVITEDGVERKFIPGDELPRFWEGKEVLGEATRKPLAALSTVSDVAPMAVEV